MSHADVLSPVIGGTSLVEIPAHLWRLYVDYLWNPSPGSWVSNVASIFRILALLSILPFAILTLLDVVSYVIARTLGVVDTTKASTNDKRTLEELVTHGAGSASDEDLNRPTEHTGPGGDGSVENPKTNSTSTTYDKPRYGMRINLTDAQSPHDIQELGVPEPPAFFFSPSEEKSLELSGANSVSPTISRQSSPPIERQKRDHPLYGESSGEAEASTSNSSSDTEPFTILARSPEVGKSILRKRDGARLDPSVSKT